MPQVKCLLCGAINDTRAPDYPFCVGCQTNLAKCGVCGWFDRAGSDCTHPTVRGLFEVSEDATPPCGSHAPRDAVVVRRAGRWAFIVIGLATAVFALGYAITHGLNPPAAPPSDPQALRLTAEGESRSAVVGRSYTVNAQITNRSDEVVEGVRFEIDRQSLEQFHLSSIRPEPLSRSDSPRSHVLSYPAMHPGEQRSIALQLEPRYPGTLHIVLRLVSRDGVYHGMADLPISVTKPEGSGSLPAGAEEEEP